MKRVRVALGLAPYDILIGRGVLRHEALRRVLGQGASGVVVSSKQIMDLHSATLQAALHAAGFKCGKPLLLPEGEAAKTVQQWDRMMRSMAQARLDRSSFVIAFGGGSIGDAAGFAAASYMRGIRVIQIPTTLLSMVDSSVGGKTGLNLREGKNLVGAFHQPGLVLADLDFLKTLPPREHQSGAFEILKCGILSRASLVDLMVKTRGLRTASEAEVESAVALAVAIKARIVEGDERENGDRILLNFGHTLGHALEAATSYRVFTHGEAVGYGMEFAVDLGEAMGMTPAGEAERLRRAVRLVGVRKPIVPSMVRATRASIFSDKKRRGARLSEILVARAGRPSVHSYEAHTLAALVQAWLESHANRSRERAIRRSAKT